MHKAPPCPMWLLGPLIATCCATALAQSDDASNTLKIGYAAINFHANSGDLTGPPSTTPAGARTEIDNARTDALVYEHRVSGPWSFVAQIGVPPTLNFKGAGTAAALGQIGSAKAWFPAALITYTFTGPQTLRPYVGAGVNYTFFTQGQASPAYTYQMSRGYGADTVQENDATPGITDVLSFGAGVNANQLWFGKSGNNLQVSIIGTADTAILQNWYSGSAYHVEQIKSGDGKVLQDSQVDQLVQAMAGFAPPAMGQVDLSTAYAAQLASVLAASWH